MVFCRWGQWGDILTACRFKKRQLSIRDVENISRTMVTIETVIVASLDCNGIV